MNIEEKAKEIKDYFINKVVTGDFKIVKFEEHTTTIEIDSKYKFKMWTTSGKEYYDFYSYMDHDYSNILNLTLKGLKSRGWIHIKKYIKDYNETILKREKMKQFNRLKKELSIT